MILVISAMTNHWYRQVLIGPDRSVNWSDHNFNKILIFNIFFFSVLIYFHILPVFFSYSLSLVESVQRCHSHPRHGCPPQEWAAAITSLSLPQLPLPIHNLGERWQSRVFSIFSTSSYPTHNLRLSIWSMSFNFKMGHDFLYNIYIYTHTKVSILISFR